MNKYKVLINPIKQENWINDIQKDGYRLKNIIFDFLYVFEESENIFTTRVDYKNYMSKTQFEEYQNIYEELGWTYIKGNRWGMSPQYWSKIGNDNDILYSDRESKIFFYKKYAGFTLLLALISLSFLTAFLPFTQDILFLTPGLWEMQGTEFWSALFFELPFVLLRASPAIFITISGFILLVMFFILLREKNKLEKQQGS